MYKIGIDARLYSQTGVGVYLRNLLHFLEIIDTGDFQFYVYLLKEDSSSITFKNSRFVKRVAPYHWHTLSEQIGYVKKLYRDNLDLMHFTYFSYPVLYKKKFISTVHDATPLNFKTGKASTKNPLLYEIKFHIFKFVISQQIKNARKIITPTETVKKQLVEIYGKSIESKITSLYEGVNYELLDVARRHPELDSGSKIRFRNKFGMTVERPFFIYVGNFYPHKNVERLIEAFAKVKEDVRLVLVGPNDFFTKRLFQLINKLEQTQRIIFYHNPKREDIVFFYKNAQALIHPSLSEGFGLPIIEATYFNLPVIASKISVFKELLEDSYVSFNPNDSNDIALKLENFLKHKTVVDYSMRLKKFSFKNMAKSTYEIYKEVLR